jgi:hypothetical protein
MIVSRAASGPYGSGLSLYVINTYNSVSKEFVLLDCDGSFRCVYFSSAFVGGKWKTKTVHASCFCLARKGFALVRTVCRRYPANCARRAPPDLACSMRSVRRGVRPLANPAAPLLTFAAGVALTISSRRTKTGNLSAASAGKPHLRTTHRF